MKKNQSKSTINIIALLFLINITTAQQIEVFSYKDGAIFGIPFNYPGYLYCDDINTCLKGNNSVAYNNNQQIGALGKFNNGYIASFSGGGVYINAEDKSLGSGRKVRTNGQRIHFFMPYKGGVVTVFEQGGVYWSPDGNNLGGPKPTQKLYSGSQKVTALMPYKGGFITAFDGGGAYWTPDGKNIAGGGNTQSLHSRNSKPQRIKSMIPYKNGFITLFEQGGVYYSPDGKNYSGGGKTKRIGSDSGISYLVNFNNGLLLIYGEKKIVWSENASNIDGKTIYYRKEKPKPTPTPIKKPVPINCHKFYNHPEAKSDGCNEHAERMINNARVFAKTYCGGNNQVNWNKTYFNCSYDKPFVEVKGEIFCKCND